MTPGGLRDYRDRSLAVAIKLRIAGRQVEAQRWRDTADRYNALLQQELPVFGPKAET